jgi:membrane protease YdiL (CAAX protease family)
MKWFFKRFQDKKLGRRMLFLWLLCIVGSWTLFPYIQYLGVVPSTVSTLQLFLIGTLQAALFYGLICWLTKKILPKTDLDPFAIKDLRTQIIYPGVIAGALVGLIIYLIDKTVFHSTFSGVYPPMWTGALASIYGGINEEVLLRLFLFTLLFFLFSKLFKFASRHRLYFLWITNILVALVFGLGHLPAAFKLMQPTSSEITRILLLNGIPGIVFGWLYWSRGIWAAMAAHFVADLVIHVFLI